MAEQVINFKKAIKMYNDGMTTILIARHFGVQSQSIRRVLKKYGNWRLKQLVYKNKQTKEELAYIAGLLDGEGTIVILKRISGKYTSYTLRVEIINTNLEVIMWLKDKIGGSIVSTDMSKYGSNRRVCYRWCLSAKSASMFLTSVLPYLIIKKNQAEVAVKFQNRLNHSKITKDEAQTREDFMNLLKDMKKKNYV